MKALWWTLILISLVAVPVTSARQRLIKESEPPRVLCLGVHAEKAEVTEGEWVRLEANAVATTLPIASEQWKH